MINVTMHTYIYLPPYAYVPLYRVVVVVVAVAVAVAVAVVVVVLLLLLLLVVVVVVVFPCSPGESQGLCHLRRLWQLEQLSEGHGGRFDTGTALKWQYQKSPKQLRIPTP